MTKFIKFQRTVTDSIYIGNSGHKKRFRKKIMENPGMSGNGGTKGNRLKIRIPLFSGRPEREKPISGNDIFNLKIALHVCKSLDDLLKNL